MSGIVTLKNANSVKNHNLTVENTVADVEEKS